MPFIQAHLEDNDAEELALKADVDYEFEGSDWIDSLKVGVRYSDREQNIRYSSFNWTPIAASWNCNGPGFHVDNSTPAAYPAGCGARRSEERSVRQERVSKCRSRWSPYH